ncbi:nicotinate-nucleotide--dimethylbenzimidazole phosphoribosyltransferase, partial [Embleya sp. NPDC059267]|uniref:nicotinate-nucleotide--dimethylbenzimidazole phosphoribosyltransferase n=1 Tax=Embleya sp. NPDC059267 TaxID=3346798 RepID=UPI00368237D8
PRFASAPGGTPPAPIGAPRVVLFAADHGVAAHDVSVRRPGRTAREVRATLGAAGRADRAPVAAGPTTQLP